MRDGLKIIRFISTGVENVIIHKLFLNPFAVHLHWCGERFNHHGKVMSIYGSSPLVWRTLTLVIHFLDLRRFISTGVENVRLIPELLRDIAVHLHWCGERSSDTGTIARYCGSSPLVWRTSMEEFLKQL